MSTPDVFISYAHDDGATARLVADALCAAGLEVWWDDALRSGEVFDEKIEEALRAAKAVVVLWSPSSVRSRWVRAEATLADRNKTLVPAMIAPCERPIIFEMVQTADLTGWKGGAGDPAWQAFVSQVCTFAKVAAPRAVSVPERPLPKLDQTSVVVLPFANMSGDPEQEYFADGISEDVITDLSQVSALMVIARNTSFTFKGKHVDVPEVARQLSVTHVLEGSVRKAGNRVRVTAQLIDGTTGGHVWAQRWDRDLDDIFELQDELSKAIVDALKVQLLPNEKAAIEDRGTENLEAYDLYLRARGLFNSVIPENNAKAAAAYRRAVELDPQFALAWAGLSESLSQESIYAIGDRSHLIAEMEDAFQRAWALAPDRQELNVTRGYRAQREHDWEELDLCYRTWDGKSDDGWGFFSLSRLTVGKAQEAAERQLELRRADPLSIGITFVLQFSLDCAGRLDEAEAEYERSAELDGSQILSLWRAIERAMVRGDRARVEQLFREEWEDASNYQPYRDELLTVFDKPEEALALLRRAVDDPICQDGARQNSIGAWAAFFGDHDFAAEQVYRGTVPFNNYVVSEIWHPIYAGVRKTERFKDTLREIGLVDYWRVKGDWGDFARPLGDDDFEIIA